jgi:hypothetical protein
LSKCSIKTDLIMFTGRQKIVKANGAEPDEFEASVAQELFNLEVIVVVTIEALGAFPNCSVLKWEID